jgi:hypothetical protein
MKHVSTSARESSRYRPGIRNVFVLPAVIVFCAHGPIGRCASDDHGTWTGYVTDTHCGTNCQVTSTMVPDLKCIRECVKRGSKYGLWSGKQVYVLQPQAEAARFAAKSVRVMGTLQGDTIQTSRIEPASNAAEESAR